MMSVAILIDRPKSVPQLLCDRTLKISKIHVFKFNINAIRFSSFLVFIPLNISYQNYFFFHTIHLQISANCKTIPATVVVSGRVGIPLTGLGEVSFLFQLLGECHC